MEARVKDFKQEKECVYKDERYSVRDNGAVLRHCREGKKTRPTDNLWTFGKPNEKTGYMDIGSARVHRIVATAFYGEPPTKEHVVDHIDTNRRNNRPENLRWLTRLENVLLNPDTRNKIEFRLGCSIEEFLANPAKFRNKLQNSNFDWMRSVTEEEGKNMLKNIQALRNIKNKTSTGGKMGEWIYREQNVAETSDLVISKTINAVQRNWKTPSEFPCCPQKIDKEPIAVYAKNLKTGVVFSRNDFSEHLVLDSAVNGQSILVMCENKMNNPVKPWSVAQITYENGSYVHENMGSFFKQKGAEKQFTIAQGLEWIGGNTIDDYC